MKSDLKKSLKQTAICVAAALGAAQPAWAGNVAHCEALIMQVVPSEDGLSEAQIASYRPAVGFLASLYDEEDGHLSEIDGFPIRAIMCRRNDVIPSADDYPILATGLPFVLSQDFDRSDTDSLTVFWKEETLDYVYKGHPLSDESQKILETRLDDFSERGKTPAPVDDTDDAPKDMAETAAEETAQDIVDMADNLDIEDAPEDLIESAE